MSFSSTARRVKPSRLARISAPLRDSVLRIRDSRGQTLHVNDDGGRGLASRIEFTAAETSDYFAEVASWARRYEGSYGLYLRAVEQILAEDDHGNRADDATSLAIGQDVEGRIEVGRDQDMFRFEAVAGHTYLFETRLGTLRDSTLSVLASDGRTQRAFNDDGGVGLASKLRWTAERSGTHFVLVKAYSSRQTGTYTLISEDTYREPLMDDHGDGAETATVVTAPSSTAGVLHEGDSDWFRLDVRRGTTYRFRVELGTLRDSTLRLRDRDGNSLAFDDDGGPGLASELTWIADRDTVIYVDVRAYRGSQVGTYTLHINEEAGGSTETETTTTHRRRNRRIVWFW